MAGQYFFKIDDKFLPLSGGTVSGDTYVSANLSADTLSLVNTPTNDNSLTQILSRDSSDGLIKYRDVNSIIGAASADTYVVSGNADVATSQLSFTYNTGGTFTVANSAALFSDNDINVTGGTYNPVNGCVTFSTNSGTTFDVCGFVTGITDTYVTGGTYNSSTDTIDLTRTDSATVSITGVSDTFYWTTGSTGNYSIRALNDTAVDATGDYAVAEGSSTASGDYSHAEGYSRASGDVSHSEGNSVASGLNSHSEGGGTTASGRWSHSEGGGGTIASADYSHAEGFQTTASGNSSHAEGYRTVAGDYSHAEGMDTTALNYSHATGYDTKAIGVASYAGGGEATATGDFSFIHSVSSLVSGSRSVVLGGQSLTGATDDTVYVPFLNINNLAPGTSINSLGIDIDGNVVTGSADENNITRVQPGTNINTGGTANNPIVNLDDNISLNSVSANTLSGATIYSGSTDLYDIFLTNADGNDITRVQNGINTFTGGTENNPTINVTALTIDNITVSGDSSFDSVSATTIYSGSTDLSDIFLTTADGNDITRVQGGINTFTGGTGNNPTVNVTGLTVDNISVSGISSFQSVSATTIYSGSTDLYNIIESLDTYITGGTYDESTDSITLGRNDAGKVLITGITDTFYWTTGSTGNFSLKAINDSGLDATGSYAVAEGGGTIASGNYSHAEGFETTASSPEAHSEGYQTTASGEDSHAENLFTISSGDYSHAEGWSTTASGEDSHSEGFGNVASGADSHAEGLTTSATTTASHSEGFSTASNGIASHAEGFQTTATEDASHSEGYSTVASGLASHSEGFETTALASFSHAGGSSSIASGSTSFIHSTDSLVTGDRSVVLGGQNITGTTDDTVYVPYLNINNLATGTSINNLGIDASGNVVTGSTGGGGGTGTTVFTTGSTGSFSIKAINTSGVDATADYSFASGFGSQATGVASHAEGGFPGKGYFNIAAGQSSHAEGANTRASGDTSHAEGFFTTAIGNGSHAEGNQSIAYGDSSHAEGELTVASGETSHAEGYQTTASGDYSHAEGISNVASGDASHVEGGFDGKGSIPNTASGVSSHAEGGNTTASGALSHAEGTNTVASGSPSHAEGISTTAFGTGSHTEGEFSTASGRGTHAEGKSTLASGDYSHAGGFSSIASGPTSFIHSTDSLVTGNRSVVLGGQNITGTTDDTVYVPYLNINTLATGTSVNNLGIDVDGNVVTGSTGGGSDITRVQGGTNITTGGTANSPTVNLDSDISLTSVFATNVSGGTIYSGSTDISDIFLTTADGNDITRVQGGTNITTGGTANSPTVNLDSDISLTSVFATNVSGGTIYSGSTDISDIFLTPDLNNGEIFVGNTGNTAQSVVMTGDVNVDNTGVATIQSDVVTYDKIQDITQRAILGSEATSGGTVIEIPVVDQFLSTGVVTSLLSDTANWDINGNYTGSTISGTFQSQMYYDGNYFFIAVLDNVWTRLIRG